ncbi:MAG TPA: YkgJ family cysteine cluster protein [Rhodocyclaceae bacterium]|nr:YkgJ family cysteine cluster protein [Rhodocyclaceae bacterium]
MNRCNRFGGPSIRCRLVHAVFPFYRLAQNLLAFCAPHTIRHMECRPLCGACCIAPSISSPIPGMPHGKPAGVACVQLTKDWRCAIFGKPERPECCSGLQASREMCGNNREQAMSWLINLERLTKP